MISNYTQKRDQSTEVLVMDFHRKHLLLFLNRFSQLLARFTTPSSSLLSHDVFLVVEAATVVAEKDWSKNAVAGQEHDDPFSKYFTAYRELKSGAMPLKKGVALCIDALAR